MNQSPRSAGTSSSVLRCGVVLLFASISIAAQSEIIRPSAQTNSSKPGPRQHVATLRSSDSPEGSRVVISSDRSLNDYEAYRRGDRFYVKIPAGDVPRAEAVRGRGFADVKAQRSGDSTVLSFRLQPGATAHVEQRSNKLDVVVTVPGASAQSAAPTRNRESARSNPGPEPLRSGNANKRNNSPAEVSKNAASRSSAAAPLSSNSNSNSKIGSTAASKASTAKPTPTPAATPRPSPTPKLATPTPAQKTSQTAGASPATTSVTPPAQPRDDAWTQMKARAHYWILLAQLNPIPVATGAVLLLLVIGLFLFQRRRFSGARRGKRVRTRTKTAQPVAETPASVAAATESELKPSPAVSVAEAAVATSAISSAASAPDEISEVVAAPPIATAVVSETDGDERRQRVAHVTEQAKKLFAGDSYDEAVIGSDDRETRRLVGAELLSALVGRNAPRRERAREGFMKHGYFDDATRDLRIAESANERAAAARRLSFVHDREATPHLIGALNDPAADVRRAAVEALMDLRDPAAIAPLNALMQTENDRKVPRTLIKHAIEACATSASSEIAPAEFSSAPLPESSSHVETEREVIEI